MGLGIPEGNGSDIPEGLVGISGVGYTKGYVYPPLPRHGT